MATDINDLAKQYILPGVLKNQNTTPSSPGVPNATPDWMQQAAGYTPPVSPQQPQQQSSGRSILGSVGHGIGEALHVGNEVLGASQKYLARPILGAVTRVEVSDPVWKIIGPHSNISEEQRNQIRVL